MPDFPPASGDPDITISYGPVKERVAVAETPETSGRHRIVNRFKSDYFDADIWFEIDDATTLTIETQGAIELKTLQSWVIQLMAVMLRQRGYIVLHGSAVARDGTAMAFLGESGWGKSTLAEFCVQQGYSFLTDDMLVLDASHDPPSVLPGPQFIRLHPDVGSSLVTDYEELPLVSERLSKRARSIKEGANTAISIGKIYILDREAADSNRVEDIASQPALLHLLTHTRSKGFLKDAAATMRQLTTYADLIARVPVSRLRRIRSLDALGDLLEVIESDLKQSVSSV